MLYRDVLRTCNGGRMYIVVHEPVVLHVFPDPRTKLIAKHFVTNHIIEI